MYKPVLEFVTLRPFVIITNINKYCNELLCKARKLLLSYKISVDSEAISNGVMTVILLFIFTELDWFL